MEILVHPIDGDIQERRETYSIFKKISVLTES